MTGDRGLLTYGRGRSMPALSAAAYWVGGVRRNPDAQRSTRLIE